MGASPISELNENVKETDGEDDDEEEYSEDDDQEDEDTKTAK